MNTNNRFPGSPFAIGAFILSALTGLLLVLHTFTEMSQPTHLWLSSLFVIAVVLHTVINWKQFT
jgi:hypothetical protein